MLFKTDKCVPAIELYAVCHQIIVVRTDLSMGLLGVSRWGQLCGALSCGGGCWRRCRPCWGRPSTCTARSAGEITRSAVLPSHRPMESHTLKEA